MTPQSWVFKLHVFITQLLCLNRSIFTSTLPMKAETQVLLAKNSLPKGEDLIPFNADVNGIEEYMWLSENLIMLYWT